MVQEDMTELRKRWYDLARAGTAITGDNRTLFNTLDGWQRQELKNAYVQGMTDEVQTWDE
ncbi:hypothetical protein pEaSNUABM49_00039 [Erwinia phage pEa_SNUABM_49]|nr:hypothetical protein pEaSNUABM49_00039 [Erwinia phage pEa_SNUABM_49]